MAPQPQLMTLIAICIILAPKHRARSEGVGDPGELDDYGTKEKPEGEIASGKRDDTSGMEELRPAEGEVPKEIFVRGMSRNVKGSRGYSMMELEKCKEELKNTINELSHWQSGGVKSIEVYNVDKEVSTYVIAGLSARREACYLWEDIEISNIEEGRALNLWLIGL